MLSLEELFVLVEASAREGAADIVLRAGRAPRWRLPGYGLAVIPQADNNPVWSREISRLAQRLSGQTTIGSAARAGLDLDFRAQFGGVAWRCNLTACAPVDLAGATAEQAATRARDLCLTLRRLGSLPPDPGQLGLDDLDAWLPAQGLVLVSGVPGSGKTTLISSVLMERVRRRPELIMTYESPVEIDLQFEVEGEPLSGQIVQHDLPWDLRDPDSALSSADRHYAHAMRNLVRRAADGVFLGEVRTSEVAQALLDAVRIGLVVYTTIHALSASLSPARLIGLLPADEQKAAANALRDGLRLLVHASRTSEGGFQRNVVPVTEDLLPENWMEWGRVLAPLERQGVEITPTMR